MSEKQEQLIESDEVPAPGSTKRAEGGYEVAATESLGFTEALAEIEKILAGIESDEIDLDELADALGRAASLLELCRAKIRRAEHEVGQVSERLQVED